MIRRSIIAATTLALAACGGSDDSAAPEASQAAAPAPAPIATAAYEPKPAVDTAEGIFARQCAYCHAPGVDHPGTMQLAATRGEELAVLAISGLTSWCEGYTLMQKQRS